MSKNNYYNDSVNQGVIPILKTAKVVDNSDSNKAGLIKVRITGVDSKESTKNLIDCVPLLPKFLNVIPNIPQLSFFGPKRPPPPLPWYRGYSSFPRHRKWGPGASQPASRFFHCK